MQAPRREQVTSDFFGMKVLNVHVHIKGHLSPFNFSNMINLALQ